MNLVNCPIIGEYNNSIQNLKTIEDLPALSQLIARYNVFPKLLYFNNTTDAFYNLLNCLFSSNRNGSIVHTSLDHSCLSYSKEIFGDNNLSYLDVTISLHSGDIDNIYKNLIRNSGTKDSPIVFLPHVHAYSGIILDINSVADIIKRQNPNAIIIVDGAQAIGNVEIDISNSIDFYVGCTHKWLCTKNTCGFISINPLMNRLGNTFFEALYQRDVFAGFSEKSKNKLYSKSTIDTFKLLNLVQDLNRVVEIETVPISPDYLKKLDSLNCIPVTQKYQSQFKGYWGNTKILNQISLDLCGDLRLISKEESLPKDNAWIRLQNPRIT